MNEQFNHWVLATSNLSGFATTSGLSLTVMGAKLFATKSAAINWLATVPPYSCKLTARKVSFNVEIS